MQAIQEAGDNVYGVWMSKEICDEEVLQEERIQKRMQARQVPVRYIPGKQLGESADAFFCCLLWPSAHRGEQTHPLTHRFLGGAL